LADGASAADEGASRERWARAHQRSSRVSAWPRSRSPAKIARSCSFIS
jgi:hypothetical protein